MSKFWWVQTVALLDKPTKLIPYWSRGSRLQG